MFCKNCGEQIPDNAGFCNACGAKVEMQSAPMPVFAQPNFVQPNYNQVNNAPVMTVGQYIITFLLASIPIAGFVLMLVWAFDSDSNPNKKNYCRAALIMSLIRLGLAILFIVIIISFGYSLINFFSVDGFLADLFDEISYYI